MDSNQNKYQMDDERRPTRHLESRGGASRAVTADSFRASTVDSGFGSANISERSTTLDSRATNGTLSSLSRDTPTADHENTERQEHHDDRPVRISPTSVLGSRCYEQAYVSHIDHPSAFFLQLAHFEKKYIELHKEINNFYSTNPMTDPSMQWKRGDYCIAKYKDNVFYRVRIIATPEVTKTPGVYDVVLLDHGRWDKVASNDIHTLLPKFATLTAQAIPCSLTKTLPRSGTWFDHPIAMKKFEDLVGDEFVDATFYPKSMRDHWPLMLVDLKVSSTKIDVREILKESKLIREVSNDEIYLEFNHLIKEPDYIIYSIPHEGEENDDDDI